MNYDYIVVGAGTAGCVIASRLSENPQARVLLIEAGRMDKNPFIHIPGGFHKVLESPDAQIFTTEPQANVNGRKMYIPQARVVGGGSSVNAMIYIRGSRADYDTWAQMGNYGWSYEDVLPVFKDLESNQRLTDDFHGNDGPLKVSDRHYGHPLSWAFLRAAQQAGQRYNEDFNGSQQEGVGFFQVTVAGGRRISTAVAFLRQAQSRDNLTILTGVQVSSLVIENQRAVGIELVGTDGQATTYRCAREVVLTAGALSTPKIMQLSGIGPADHLASVGIDPVIDLPGVGENYQDHLECYVQGETIDPISMAYQDKGLRAVRHMAQYMLFKTGLLTTNVVEAGGFVDTLGTGTPDMQMACLPILVGDVDREAIPGHGISVNTSLLRPRSRGTVRLRSADPADAILFDSNSLSDPEDLATLKRGVRLAISVLEAPELQKLVKRRLLPEPGVEGDETALDDYVRATAKTIYHPSGTCKMGPDHDAMAVVDPRLRVRDVQGLRIGDASIMPNLISGNTNAPTIMIAERCARFIAADQG